LKHECAYCLGQLQNPIANEMLINVLKDKKEDPMVRHECAEALAAIGHCDDEVINILKEYSSDSSVEVAETCQIALDRLQWIQNDKMKQENENLSTNPYNSVDPAPPAPQKDVKTLKEILLNESESLFVRYRAMFSLRNEGSDEAILAICAGKLS
jgi:deoxyhypusine monooxygenase